jgi:hypothetical protein
MLLDALQPTTGMKTPSSPLRRLAALAALLLGAVTAPAQLPFPYGDWDCAISERQSGIAVIRFEAGTNTINGLQIMRPNYANGNLIVPGPNPRFSGGDPTRTGQEPATTTSGSSNLFVGATAIRGSWFYDSTNRILGFLDQVTLRYELSEVVTTNLNELTGLPVYLTNLVYTNIYTTNSISFRASGTAGQRLTLAAYLPDGKKNIYRGTPCLTLTNQSGDYYASGKRRNVPFVESFNLEPNPAIDLPNVYGMNGYGAGYGFTGWAIVSRRNSIAIYQQTDRDPYRITTYLGPYNLTQRKGSINGYDDTGRKPSYRVVGY